MRIIAGERRGHKLEGPTGRQTRPTSDLVRESIYNIIGPLLDDRLVYDLFAGTGAMGLEALSRGARKTYFIERDRQNVALIHRNIAHLRYEDRTHVYQADALRWMKSYRPIDDEPIVILIDPPYRDYQSKGERISTAVHDLISRLPQDSVVVIEAPDRFESDVLPSNEKWDIRKYGGTAVAFCVVGELSSDEPPPHADSDDES